MKLSAVRPCDSCGNPIGLSFNVVRHSGALAGGQSAREVVGLTALVGGSLTVAEALAPRADDAVMVFADEDKKLQTELLLCHECCHARLGGLLEAANRETV